jgi:hypothetical protein
MRCDEGQRRIHRLRFRMAAGSENWIAGVDARMATTIHPTNTNHSLGPRGARCYQLDYWVETAMAVVQDSYVPVGMGSSVAWPLLTQ